MDRFFMFTLYAKVFKVSSKSFFADLAVGRYRSKSLYLNNPLQPTI